MNGIKYRKVEELVDSGVEWMGEIPRDWEVKKVKHIASVFNGATPKTSIGKYWDGNINWYTPTDFKKTLLSDSWKKITAKGLNSCGTRLVPKETVLITCRAPIGNIGIVKNEFAAFNQGCKSVVPKKVDKKYLFYFLLHSVDSLKSKGKGTTFMELSNRDLGDTSINLPSVNEQKKVANFLDYKTSQFDSIIKKKEQLILKLEEAKKSLISEVVTGKVKIVDGKLINPNSPQSFTW